MYYVWSMNMPYSVKRKRAMFAIFSAAGRPVDFAGLLEVNKCERRDCTLRVTIQRMV